MPIGRPKLAEQAELSGTATTFDARFGSRVRALRTSRGWSQAQLARELGVSQPVLSQLEAGRSTLSVERFLRLLRLFNIGVEHFDDHAPPGGSALQNALARHGASHLRASDALTPSALDEPHEAVWQVLRHPESTRHVTALAPLLVATIDRIGLRALAARLDRIGLGHRLGWLLANVLAAVKAQPGTTLDERRRAQRFATAAELALASAELRPPTAEQADASPPDLLDPEIRSVETALATRADASDLSRRWGIVSRLHPSDFADALDEARRNDRHAER